MTDEEFNAVNAAISAANGDTMETCGLTLQWDKKTGNVQIIPVNTTREQCICLLKNVLDNLCNGVLQETRNASGIVLATGNLPKPQ